MDKNVTFKVHFIKGAYLEINGENSNKEKYKVYFINKKNNTIVYETRIGVNSWAKTSKTYFIDWKIEVRNSNGYVVFEHEMDLKDKRVYIAICSSSLGDTLAWFPVIEEFRKQTGCNVICSTFHNYFFEDTYPNIEFIKPGQVVNNLYGMYEIGWFYDNGEVDYNKVPFDFKKFNLQYTASHILGLDIIDEIKPKISHKIENITKKKSVCIAIHSTAQAKYWNNSSGWQEVCDYLKTKGYEVILISKETGDYMGNVPPSGITNKTGDIPLHDRMKDLLECEFFIGIGSGLSWLSWAMGTKTVIISGFSEAYSEYADLRIINESVCHGCFNNYKLDPSDWNWCPVFKNTENQFICTKKISSNYVISKLEDMLKK